VFTDTEMRLTGRTARQKIIAKRFAARKPAPKGNGTRVCEARGVHWHPSWRFVNLPFAESPRWP